MRIISPEFRYGSDSECGEVTVKHTNKLYIRLEGKKKDADLARSEQHLVSSKEDTGVGGQCLTRRHIVPTVEQLENRLDNRDEHVQYKKLRLAPPQMKLCLFEILDQRQIHPHWQVACEQWRV
jgi:hypothetical protein